ncbi:THUMP domain-containing protein [Acidianus brierleyi]|uniref:RNA methyltransferase n=1 Tax=Acidianus brierleyi TaxID=41673 RepID=A0A2U9IIV6_9CREN|nr:THUMP domain-containing protein [Acidianus brierleyi]AWR95960.1 RNA methyltransferase [Acidianus brierleyi]
MEPKVLVTTASNKGNKCVVEILNRIFIKDSNAIAKEITQNVIIVETSLSPIETYGLIISAPPACAKKIFPINMILPLDTKLIICKVSECLTKLHISKFFVNCYVRSGNFDCKMLEIGIALKLKGLLSVDYKTPDKVVNLNIIKDTVYVSILNKDQEKVSVKSLG